MKRRGRLEVLDQQHGEYADEIRRALEPLGDPTEFDEDVATPVDGQFVIQITCFEYRVQQLILGLEMMQQPGLTDAGLLGDLRQ